MNPNCFRISESSFPPAGEKSTNARIFSSAFSYLNIYTQLTERYLAVWSFQVAFIPKQLRSWYVDRSCSSRVVFIARFSYLFIALATLLSFVEMNCPSKPTSPRVQTSPGPFLRRCLAAFICILMFANSRKVLKLLRFALLLGVNEHSETG